MGKFESRNGRGCDMSTVGNCELMENIKNSSGKQRREYLQQLVITELTDWEVPFPKKLNSKFLSGIYMRELNYLTDSLCYEPNDILEYKYQTLIEQINCFD